jgi:two-component system cell cycle sensor histidine kinase/response regulator CckA
MRDQIFLLGNLVIMAAYAAIMVAIVVPVAKAGQLRSNRLAVATALIFFSCSVGHGLHAFMAFRALTHPAMPGMPHGMPEISWTSVSWDLFTAVVGVYYWSLRRGYGVLLGKGAIYVDPWGQHRLDEAGAREKAARDTAESHRAMLAAVVEDSDDAIIGTAMDGFVTAWNGGAERLFGYTAEEAVGRPASFIADAAGADEQAGVLDRIARGERGVRYEARRLRRDGTAVDIAFTVAPIRDSGGTAIGISVVARDITAAKEAEQRQREVAERTHQAQRMESLGRLAGGVAHDFNNILAIIGNYTEFAIEQSGDRPEVQADLAQVRTGVDRAVGLTRQLLTFTRGDTVQPRDVDLGAAIAEVRSMLDRTIGEHITVLTVPPPEPLLVHADPGQIQQVLLNLSLNARDAMPDGGTLVLEAGTAVVDGAQLHLQPPLPAGTYARLVVSDTGEGMPPEVAERIFEPFFTTKARGQGTGLGLATVYGIVAEAGGSINVYSEAGVGTTFRIYLPLVSAPSAAPAPETAVAVPDGAGRRVLVVEDEPALARVVARILTDGGYRVQVATGGQEALALAAEQGCDLVLTDVIMPEMSGRRLAELLWERRPGLPVLYMSGYSNGLLGTTHILDPGVALLEKPFSAVELLTKVGAVLAGAEVPARQPQ